MAKAAKWSLPSWVQTPFRCLWRAPVSSTLTQPAVAQPGPQHLARLGEEGVLARVQQADDLALGDQDADRPELGHQARHGDLALVVLGQHEAAQLRPEVADDAGRHRREHGPAVGGQPALAAEAHDVRAEHQVLDQEVLVALEARAGGDVRLDDALLVDGEPLGLAPATASPVRGTRLGLAFSMPLGFTSGRPFTPLSVATSACSSATACFRASFSASSRSAKASSSPRGRPERGIFAGADMPGTGRVRASPAQPRQLTSARPFAPRTVSRG